MASWVHVFSKFTPEALLFEALIICMLFAGYSAFWVLRKRRYGVLGKEHPNYAVKSYLSQLILDAEQMRIQLFGLLAGTGVDPGVMAQLRGGQAGVTLQAGPSAAMPGISAAALAADPGLAAKLAAIESKMAEQARAMEMIVVEKNRAEKELTEVRSGKGGTAAAGGAVDPALTEKLKTLEAKLAEYSVIEDDLANLKRLQQENTALRAQLGGRVPATTPVVAPAAAAAKSVTETGDIPVDTGALEAASAVVLEETVVAAEAAAATAASLAEAAAEAPIAASTADAGFEGLVDQVEQSLAEPGAGATSVDPGATAPVTELAPIAAAPAAATHSPAEKTDADLVAEFEKMLNS